MEMAEVVRRMSGRSGWTMEEEGLDMTGRVDGVMSLVI